MNWVTTHIRLPEDLYMQLKNEAAQKKKSVDAVVREKLTGKPQAKQGDKMHLLERLQKVAKKIAEENKGANLSQELIKLRYEQ